MYLLSKIYIGIDLAAKEHRCSGFAYIVCNDICRIDFVKCIYSNDDIVKIVGDIAKYNPYISIDAPFNLGNGIRDVDRKMISMGFRVFPPKFSYMKLLTLRAIRIINDLKALGISNIYETHPRSALLNSRCRSIRELLQRLSIRYSIDIDNLKKDQKDAIICAAVSYCIDNNCYIKIEGSDGIIWILDKVCSNLLPTLEGGNSL